MSELTRTFRQWLHQRGLPHSGGFLEPRLADLSRPDRMADRDVVAERLARAVRRKEVIAVFGDYDCDGITSTVILTQALRQLGGAPVPLLANRFAGGYGVSAPAARRVADTDCQLLVTCDCGSSDHETLTQLRDRGVDVVVIDHHLVPERPLPAVGFLNPHRPECQFPFKGLASCGLALSVAAAVRQQLGVELDVRQWLDLVAIGTVADVAPLEGDNRPLVRAGLRTLRQGRRPGLRALLELARVSMGVPLTGRDIAFRIAPLINAPGRLGAPDVAAELLLATDASRAQKLAGRVWELGQRRRALQDEMLAEAEAEIERTSSQGGAALVLGREGWSPGIVGIVAGRLADRHGVPTVVMGFEGGVGRGSVRGPAGSRLHSALGECSPLIERFGGHQQAAGLELKISQVEAFRQRFCEAIEAQGPPQARPAQQPLELHPADDPLQVLHDLDKLEPCGEKNPRPRLSVRGRLRGVRQVGDGHLKLTLELSSDRLLDCFAPRQSELLGALRQQGAATALGDLRHSDFPGAAPVEFFAEELRPG